MRDARAIEVVTENPHLGGSLAKVLPRLTGRRVTVAPGLSDTGETAIVLTTTTDCSTAECAGLTQAGKDVIVLSAVPSPFQGDAYLAAGAAGYLPMLVDMAPLLAILSTLT